MARLTALSCGLLLGLVVPLAAGQTKDEKSTDFAVLYSKPVRVNGVDFEVVARSIWLRPAEVYGVAGTNIGLRLSNKSDKDVTFDLADTLRIGLKSADNKELVSGAVPKRFVAKPIKVAAGKSETVRLPAHLFHTRVRLVCLGLDTGVGYEWLTQDIPPGKYRLCLYYENNQKGDDIWHGKVQTESLEIQVMAGK
jgi:hypothetical protein